MKKKIYIRLTDGCNMRCAHCYAKVNYSDPQWINPYKCIDYIKDYIKKTDASEYNISFTGGEPFYCANITIPLIKKIVCSLNGYLDKIIYFDATTNLMMDSSISDVINLLKSKVFMFNDRPFIKVSYDVGYMRFKDNIELNIWESNLQKLLANVPNIYIKLNVCMTTFLVSESPKTFLNRMIKYGVHELHFERLTENTTKTTSLIPSYADMDKWLVLLYKYYRSIDSKIKIDTFENYRYALQGQFIGCAKRECMWNVITINPDMSVGGCPNVAFLTDEENIEALREEEKTKHEMCYACDLYQMCNGDCFQLSWQGLRCPAPKKLMSIIRNDFLLDHDRIIKNNMYCYDYLTDQRKMSYLINDFDDTNLDYIHIAGSEKEIANTVIKFFKTESQLIYPAKSYFVAIVYAACIQKLFGKDIKESLCWKDLLFDDRYFKPYSVSPKIYDMVLEKIGSPLIYKSSEKTINYFIEEFLIPKSQADILLSEMV